MYSLTQAHLLEPLQSHPSLPSCIAISSSGHLLLSASATPPIIFLQNLNHPAPAVLLQPQVSSEPVTAAAFHPYRMNIFVLAFTDGALALYDSTSLLKQSNHAGRGSEREAGGRSVEIASFVELRHASATRMTEKSGGLGAGADDPLHYHNPPGAISRSNRRTTTIEFLPYFSARVVAAGLDGTCTVVDLDSLPRGSGQLVSRWHAHGPITSLAVTTRRGSTDDCLPWETIGKHLQGIRPSGIPKMNRRQESIVIAVGSADGKVTLHTSSGAFLNTRQFDYEGQPIIGLEWVADGSRDSTELTNTNPLRVVEAPTDYLDLPNGKLRFQRLVCMSRSITEKGSPLRSRGTSTSLFPKGRGLSPSVGGAKGKLQTTGWRDVPVPKVRTDGLPMQKVKDRHSVNRAITQPEAPPHMQTTAIVDEQRTGSEQGRKKVRHTSNSDDMLLSPKGSRLPSPAAVQVKSRFSRGLVVNSRRSSKAFSRPSSVRSRNQGLRKTLGTSGKPARAKSKGTIKNGIGLTESKVRGAQPLTSAHSSNGPFYPAEQTKSRSVGGDRLIETERRRKSSQAPSVIPERASSKKSSNKSLAGENGSSGSNRSFHSSPHQVERLFQQRRDFPDLNYGSDARPRRRTSSSSIDLRSPTNPLPSHKDERISEHHDGIKIPAGSSQPVISTTSRHDHGNLSNDTNQLHQGRSNNVERFQNLLLDQVSRLSSQLNDAQRSVHEDMEVLRRDLLQQMTQQQGRLDQTMTRYQAVLERVVEDNDRLRAELATLWRSFLDHLGGIGDGGGRKRSTGR